MFGYCDSPEGKPVRKPIFLIVAVVLAVAAYTSVMDGGGRGDSLPGNTSVTHMQAPEFTLTDLSGNKLDLATYRGKVVLLDFWATWCAPCRAEIPRFVDLQKRYRDRGLRIIGISLDDDAKSVGTFYKQFKIDYPVAIGDAHLAERYGGILGLPVSFLIGCDGRIYVKHAGATDVSLIEQEIRPLLEQRGCMQTSIGN
jgi:cytochrome c biogenesis protein CcmG, thiol:disulfide interchange protein DsbE